MIRLAFVAVATKIRMVKIPLFSGHRVRLHTAIMNTAGLQIQRLEYADINQNQE